MTHEGLIDKYLPSAYQRLINITQPIPPQISHSRFHLTTITLNLFAAHRQQPTLSPAQSETSKMWESYESQISRKPITQPRIIIHGGAGNIRPETMPPERYQLFRASLLTIVSSSVHRALNLNPAAWPSSSIIYSNALRSPNPTASSSTPFPMVPSQQPSTLQPMPSPSWKTTHSTTLGAGQSSLATGSTSSKQAS